MAKEKVHGYLPDEKPPVGKLLLYALQQVIVMFPATITVALITGFQVSTTIFASGIATLCFILITGRKIPLYYGSSFAYLSAVIGLMTSETVTKALTAAEITQLNGFLNGDPGFFSMPTTAVRYAQVGIVMSGLVSIAAGLLIKFVGIKAVERILPPTITGSIAMIIGLTLAGNALADAAPNANATGVFASDWVWVVSLVTLLSTILYSRYLKGFLGQLPLLLGAATGCLAAAIIYGVGGAELNLFRSISAEAIDSLWSVGPFAIPKFSLPDFSNSKIVWTSIAAIMPIAIATIPESTAHMYQLDIYVNDVAEKKGLKKNNLIERLHMNLIGDGIGDMITGLIGGPAGTNYGENISTMAITKVFSVPVLMVAAVIAMVISCFTPLIKVIYGIPLAVIGGLEIYLFGAIAAQGIAIMIDKKADMFSAKNIAVIATIMIVGLGGQYIYGGNIPFFGLNIPCIAGAAIFGIILNAILSIGEKKQAN